MVVVWSVVVLVVVVVVGVSAAAAAFQVGSLLPAWVIGLVILLLCSDCGCG